MRKSCVKLIKESKGSGGIFVHAVKMLAHIFVTICNVSSGKRRKGKETERKIQREKNITTTITRTPSAVVALVAAAARKE